MELGTGYDCSIDNNVILNTRVHPGGTGRGNFGSGAGIYSHDASGMLIAHNLIAGSEGFGVFLRVSPPRDYATYPRDITDLAQRGGRKPMFSEASDLRVLDNIIVDNRGGAMNLPYAGPRAQRDQSDGNLIGPGQTLELNNSGGPSMDQILATIDQKLPGNTIGLELRAAMATTRQSAAAEPPPSTAPDQQRRRRRSPPLPPITLDLQQWRTVMGFGAHSQILDSATVRADRAADDGIVLHVDLSAVPATSGAAAAPWLKQDLLGRPIDAQSPVPGPIQALRPGPQQFTIWPPAQP